MRYLFIICVLASILCFANPASADHSEDGRWIDFGWPFNAIAQCEAGPTPWNPNDGDDRNNDVEVVAISDSHKGDYGIFQFRQGTWDWVNGWLGRWDLVGVRPNMTSAADQYEAAKTLAYDIPGGGFQHWSTWNNGCYQTVTDGPRFVTFEQFKPDAVETCLDVFRLFGLDFIVDSVLSSPYYIVHEDC